MMRTKNREVRVVAISQDGMDISPENAVDETFKRMDRAAAYQADLVCLPEAFSRLDPEPVPGPTTERVGAWGRAHNCWTVCAIHTRNQRGDYNSAVLIDRSGKVAGQYHKIHPTECELKKGILPGPCEPDVFDTDFGRIGMQICFDINWHAGWARLKEKGAELIVWTSAYPGERRIAVLAHLLEVFIAAPVRSRPTRIYDITGQIVAESGAYHPWAEATLHLDKRLFEIDYQLDEIHELERKYAGKVRVDWCHNDDAFTLESLDPERSVEDLIREFKLTPLQEYLKRSGTAQDKLRPR
jgi:predicted amidohydrolase